MPVPANLRIPAGEPLRIEGQRFLAGAIVEGGRIFFNAQTGSEQFLSNVAQTNMARLGRITSEAMWLAQSEARRDALEMDLDAFSPAEREVMQYRVRFVNKVNELPRASRCKEAKIQASIEAVEDEREAESKRKHPFGTPSVGQVRTWCKALEAAGGDIRSLANLNHRKGRGDQLPPWIREEVVKAIFEIHAKRPGGSLAATQRRATDRIRARADREGLTIPDRGQKKGEVIGVNVVSKVLKTLDAYQILVLREGKTEADRQMAMIGLGPQGEYPLSAVEVDHTPLDIIVVDEQQKLILGRPYLTALLDRYSRCIIGYCLSFHPPSWTTVMEALRIGVSDKQALLDELGNITQAWPCYGVPDELVSDNGKEFHSHSMQETEAALSMRILYLPRRKPWLKGKVERWFRTLENEIFHTIPGTTLSNIVKRGDYKSEEFAVLTMKQTQWLITKWVVDVYHQQEHSATGEAPADRWEDGMQICGPKLAPPPGLLVPLTGKVVYKTLAADGIRFQRLNWNSKAFFALRKRIGPNEQVAVRIDPLDLSRVYVFDKERRRWIEGDLQNSGDAKGLTLHQYEVVKEYARQIQQPNESRLEAISRARIEIFDFVEDIVKNSKKSKAGKRFARFVFDGRKPSDHIAPTRTDRAESARLIGSHPIGVKATRPAMLPPPKTSPATKPPPQIADAIALEALAVEPIVPLPVRIRKST